MFETGLEFQTGPIKYFSCQDKLNCFVNDIASLKLQKYFVGFSHI